MIPNEGSENVRLEDARLIQVDVLDGEFIVATFSNGQSAKIASIRIKELALEEPAEIARAIPE